MKNTLMKENVGILPRQTGLEILSTSPVANSTCPHCREDLYLYTEVTDKDPVDGVPASTDRHGLV